MIEEIVATLQEIAGQFADKRVHYCQVEVTAVHDSVCELGGAVLDEATRQAVTGGLARRFPSITFQKGRDTDPARAATHHAVSRY